MMMRWISNPSTMFRDWKTASLPVKRLVVFAAVLSVICIHLVSLALRLSEENANLARSERVLEARLGGLEQMLIGIASEGEMLSGQSRSEFAALTQQTGVAANMPDFAEGQPDLETAGENGERFHSRSEQLRSEIGLQRLTSQATEVVRKLEEAQLLLSMRASATNALPMLTPTQGWISSNFGNRLSPFTGLPVRHQGIDIAAPIGTVVYAPGDGVVSFADTYRGYGRLVVVDHGFGFVTRFAHNGRLLVGAGESVRRGQKIALVGRTGMTTGPHLHYEVWYKGKPIDPRGFMTLAAPDQEKKRRLDLTYLKIGPSGWDTAPVGGDTDSSLQTPFISGGPKI